MSEKVNANSDDRDCHPDVLGISGVEDVSSRDEEKKGADHIPPD